MVWIVKFLVLNGAGAGARELVVIVISPSCNKNQYPIDTQLASAGLWASPQVLLLLPCFCLCLGCLLAFGGDTYNAIIAQAVRVE